MKLPNGQHAIVDDAKLLDYVLNPAHPVGRHHAALFQRLVGITRDDYLILKNALLEGARNQEVQPGQESQYGRKYEMRLQLGGPKGSRVVLAIWLIEAGDDQPRLVTCYVE
ncbi:MAG: hypothetical protein JXQ75_14560 [Phycisphaerae bacterium]|nr:hypothetical protein [Phycisphaerae bacterium]